MENKPKRDRMAIQDRAKQFMPFAAVAGLEDALAQKRQEMIRSARMNLSEEMQLALNKILSGLKKGNRVTLNYYCNGEYITLAGEVTRIDLVERWIYVSGVHVLFDDIRCMEVVG